MAKAGVAMDFLKSFDKELEKMDGVVTTDQPPRYWTSFGSHAINRVMSGSFLRGIPQGRITAICGPSSAGKSFLAGNLVKQAQAEGSIVLVLDSENALDSTFMSGVGVDTDSPSYKRISLSTITQATKIVQMFLEGYKADNGESGESPRVLIVVDSLDYLMTEAEAKAADTGDVQFDQGQHTRMLKSMLRTWVQLIKNLNVSIVVTKQVYKARQDQLLAGEGLWVVNDAIRYACSQILLATRLKLKQEGSKDPMGDVIGIRLKAEGFKTRFGSPFQTTTVHVPYETGIDPFSGMFDIAVSLGVIVKSGSWYSLVEDGESKRRTDFEGDPEMMARIVNLCEAKQAKFVNMMAEIQEDFVEVTDNQSVKRSSKTS